MVGSRAKAGRRVEGYSSCTRMKFRCREPYTNSDYAASFSLGTRGDVPDRKFVYPIQAEDIQSFHTAEKPLPPRRG